MAKILIVDDNPAILELFRYALAKAGHQVEWATDGKRALSVLDGAAFDLILMDIQMPGLNGISALKQLRTLKNGARVPVVAMTGYTDQEKVRVEEAGFNHILTKPIRPAHLRSLVEMLCKEPVPAGAVSSSER